MEFNISNITEVGVDNGPEEVPILKKVLDILLIFIITVIMIAMGSTITIKEIWKHICRPTSIIIGMISQFIILPLCSFGLMMALSLKSEVAVGMLVLSCCPGGTMSNLFTYWLDGDVSLSITMTTFSTTLAFGMMPLNLWIYSRFWTSENLVIPYIKIFITLTMILVPVAGGMLFKRFFPNKAYILGKIGSFVGMIGILTSLIIQSILFPGMYSSPWNVWFCAAVFPMVAFALGFGFSKLTKQSMMKSKAIAFETGSQNVALAMTILFLTFPYKILPNATSFPQLYAIIMLSMYGAICGIYNIYLKFFSSDGTDAEEKVEETQRKINEKTENNHEVEQYGSVSKNADVEKIKEQKLEQPEEMTTNI